MEQCAGCRDVLSAVGVGEEPIVADAVSVFPPFASLHISSLIPSMPLIDSSHIFRRPSLAFAPNRC